MRAEGNPKWSTCFGLDLAQQHLYREFTVVNCDFSLNGWFYKCMSGKLPHLWQLLNTSLSSSMGTFQDYLPRSETVPKRATPTYHTTSRNFHFSSRQTRAIILMTTNASCRVNVNQIFMHLNKQQMLSFFLCEQSWWGSHMYDLTADERASKRKKTAKVFDTTACKHK